MSTLLGCVIGKPVQAGHSNGRTLKWTIEALDAATRQGKRTLAIRQQHAEVAALAERAVHLDRAVVRLRGVLDDRQP